MTDWTYRSDVSTKVHVVIPVTTTRSQSSENIAAYLFPRFSAVLITLFRLCNRISMSPHCNVQQLRRMQSNLSILQEFTKLVRANIRYLQLLPFDTFRQICMGSVCYYILIDRNVISVVSQVLGDYKVPTNGNYNLNLLRCLLITLNVSNVKHKFCNCALHSLCLYLPWKL